MALTTFTLPTESARDPRAPRDSGDAAFFAGYSWCLNPILTLDDQVVRLGEELHRIAGLAPGWQRDECVINVHLLVCGIACTVDDSARDAADQEVDRSEEHTSELQSR